MINRVLIRLKIVQIIYAYYQNGNKNIDTAEKELFFSLSKAYDLYNYLLLLIVEITRHAQKKIDLAQNRLTPTKEDMTPHIKLAENKFAMQLEANQQLDDFANNQKKNWAEGQEFIKKLYEEIISSSIYKEYLAIEAPAYTDDRELWRKLYKTFIFNNEELDQLLEDQSLYWNDDKAIVDTFVIKTIKRFEEKNGIRRNFIRQRTDNFFPCIIRKNIIAVFRYIQIIPFTEAHYNVIKHHSVFRQSSAEKRISVFFINSYYSCTHNTPLI